MSGRAGTANSTSASITDLRSRYRRLALALTPAILLFGLAGTGRAAFAEPAGAAVPDTSAALVVETVPSGLRILIDGLDAGRTPLGPVRLAPGRILVRAVPEDPRRFDRVQDSTWVLLAPGMTARVFLDLRPSVALQSVPWPASVFLLAAGPGAPDSLLGETPLRLPAALVEGHDLRFRAVDHADTVVAGALLVERSGASLSSVVALRRVAEAAPPKTARPPLYRRRWFQWALAGVGAGLTGAAVYFNRQGDYWYERYLTSSDPDQLDTYFERAVRYDRLSLASLAVGQVAFSAGILLLVSGSGE